MDFHTPTQLFGPAVSINVHANQDHHKVKLCLSSMGALSLEAGDAIYPKADITVFLGDAQKLALISQCDAIARQLETELSGTLE